MGYKMKGFSGFHGTSPLNNMKTGNYSQAFENNSPLYKRSESEMLSHGTAGANIKIGGSTAREVAKGDKNPLSWLAAAGGWVLKNWRPILTATGIIGGTTATIKGCQDDQCTTEHSTDVKKHEQEHDDPKLNRPKKEKDSLGTK
tara:strand:- start:1519 stop:1950 length:432 start_codon:yes stop_codon:yes gene_type:complete